MFSSFFKIILYKNRFFAIRGYHMLNVQIANAISRNTEEDLK